MGMGVLYKHRRFAAMVALVGVALYTALAPMHVVSQATADPAAGSQIAGFERAPIDCHTEPATADDAGSTGPEDSAPKKKCPFCKGYASFLTAFVGGADAATIDAERASLAFLSVDTELTYVSGRTPQNRGPPIEL